MSHPFFLRVIRAMNRGWYGDELATPVASLGLYAQFPVYESGHSYKGEHLGVSLLPLNEFDAQCLCVEVVDLVILNVFAWR